MGSIFGFFSKGEMRLGNRKEKAFWETSSAHGGGVRCRSLGCLQENEIQDNARIEEAKMMQLRKKALQTQEEKEKVEKRDRGKPARKGASNTGEKKDHCPAWCVPFARSQGSCNRSDAGALGGGSDRSSLSPSQNIWLAVA